MQLRSGWSQVSLPLPPGPQAWLLLLPGPLLPCCMALHASRLPGCQLRLVPGRQVSPPPAAQEEGVGGARASVTDLHTLSSVGTILDLCLGLGVPCTPVFSLFQGPVSLSHPVALTFALWFSLWASLLPVVCVSFLSLSLCVPPCPPLCLSFPLRFLSPPSLITMAALFPVSLLFLPTCPPPTMSLSTG